MNCCFWTVAAIILVSLWPTTHFETFMTVWSACEKGTKSTFQLLIPAKMNWFRPHYFESFNEWWEWMKITVNSFSRWLGFDTKNLISLLAWPQIVVFGLFLMSSFIILEVFSWWKNLDDIHQSTKKFNVKKRGTWLKSKPSFCEKWNEINYDTDRPLVVRA